jgi:hypothetical protein
MPLGVRAFSLHPFHAAMRNIPLFILLGVAAVVGGCAGQGRMEKQEDLARFAEDLKQALVAGDERALQALLPEASSYSQMRHAGEGQRQKPCVEQESQRMRVIRQAQALFGGRKIETKLYADNAGSAWRIEENCYANRHLYHMQVLFRRDAQGLWQVRMVCLFEHCLVTK